MVTIADKINAMLAERGLLKRDLARALGVSPQTATDICKGRSAVTLRHLRNLVRLFELRADYWIDETRIEPDPADRTADVAAPGTEDPRLARLRATGLLDVDTPDLVVRRLVEVARAHHDDWVRRFGEPSSDVRRLLGLTDGQDSPTAREAGPSAAAAPAPDLTDRPARALQAGEDAASLN